VGAGVGARVVAQGVACGSGGAGLGVGFLVVISSMGAGVCPAVVLEETCGIIGVGDGDGEGESE
jgi:hypothetical protein